MRAAYTAELRVLLSNGRLNAYRLAPADRDLDLLGRYAYNVAVAESLYPALGAAEVALRNRVFAAVEAAYPTTAFVEYRCWLDANPRVLLPEDLAAVQKAKAAVHGDLTKRHGPWKQARQYRRPGHLVAKLTFGFWTYLLQPRYAAGPTKPGKFWPQLLPDAFPNLPAGAQRDDVERAFNAVRQFRNRVFHHEPVLYRAGAEVDVRPEYDRIVEVLGWMGADGRDTVEALSRFSAVYDPAQHRALRRRLTGSARRARAGPRGNPDPSAASPAV